MKRSLFREIAYKEIVKLTMEVMRIENEMTFFNAVGSLGWEASRLRVEGLKLKIELWKTIGNKAGGKMKNLVTAIIIMTTMNAFGQAVTDTLTPATITRTGLTESLIATPGDTLLFLNDGRGFMHVKNSNGATRTITFISTASSHITVPVGMAESNTSVVIAATTGDEMIGTFPLSGYGNSDSYTMVVLSDTAGVTIQYIDID